MLMIDGMMITPLLIEVIQILDDYACDCTRAKGGLSSFMLLNCNEVQPSRKE
jgi:hypothetical protein